MKKGTDRQTSYITKMNSGDTHIKDLDTKNGIVTGYYSAFGGKDSDGDRIIPGAFKRSIDQNGPGTSSERIAHLLYHNTRMPIAKIQVLKEDQYGLYFESKMSDSTAGRDALQLYAEGILKEHSIGFGIEKGRWNEDEDVYEIAEVKLYEGSTVLWGANQNTPFTGFKSLSGDHDELELVVKAYSKILRKGNLTDETCYLLELQLKQMQQAINDLKNNSLSKTDPVHENHSSEGNPDSKVDTNLLIQSFSKHFN